ncbi:MAG: hypothetical protein ACLTER_26620 [Ruminococcus sp.]
MKYQSFIMRVLCLLLIVGAVLGYNSMQKKDSDTEKDQQIASLTTRVEALEKQQDEILSALEEVAKAQEEAKKKAEEEAKNQKHRRKKYLPGMLPRTRKKMTKIQMRQRLRTLLLRKKVKILSTKTEPTQETARALAATSRFRLHLKMTRLQTFRW